jgi:hypothetical protein
MSERFKKVIYVIISLGILATVGLLCGLFLKIVTEYSLTGNQAIVLVVITICATTITLAAFYTLLKLREE